MSVPIFQVDAFTDRPFAGNPAAVCVLPESRHDAWLQAVATEMNLSETAFLVKQPDHPEEKVQAPPDLIEALGVQARYVGRNQFDYLVEVESEAILRSMTPDFRRLAKAQVRGIIVTSRSADPRFDFVSRFFAPAAGIDEDPVTGSAHCCLGDFWEKRLGKNEFLAYQASARGGVIRVRVDQKRVYLGGKAVTVFKGELLAG